MARELIWLPVPPVGTDDPILRSEPAEIVALPSCAPDLDHEMVAGWMEEMQTKEERAAFWHDHVSFLGDALLDRGIAPEVVKAILGDHFQRVREIHQSRQGKSARKPRRPAVDLTEPPAIGTELMIGRRLARLVEVRPHVRRDGTPTVLLVWNTTDGMFTSGLRSGIYRVRVEADHGR